MRLAPQGWLVAARVLSVVPAAALLVWFLGATAFECFDVCRPEPWHSLLPFARIVIAAAILVGIVAPWQSSSTGVWLCAGLATVMAIAAGVVAFYQLRLVTMFGAIALLWIAAGALAVKGLGIRAARL